MTLIIDISDELYDHACDTVHRMLTRDEELELEQAIREGKPLIKPFAVNTDGESVYLTEGHIKALMDYEQGVLTERAIREWLMFVKSCERRDE